MMASGKLWNFLFYFGMITLVSHQVTGKVPNMFNEADKMLKEGTDKVPNSLDEISDENNVVPTDPPKVTGNKSELVDVNVEAETINVYCFPSDAFVRRKDGVKLQMKDLKMGDRVLTLDERGEETYSEVILMLHQNREDVIKDYVQITTKDGFELTLSTYHLIPISSPTTNSKFVYGKDVRPGHNVTVYNRQQFSSSEVSSVKLVTKKGAFAPLTMEGSVVVNDVYASCYASFPDQKVAHIAFSLWRWLYTYFSSSLELSTNATGIHWYPRMLMSLNSIIGY